MGPMCTRTAIVLALLALCACGKPKPPEKERPPEPQAAHAELRKVIRQPIERARQVEADVQEAADAQRAAIDAATGG